MMLGWRRSVWTFTPGTNAGTRARAARTGVSRQNCRLSKSFVHEVSGGAEPLVSCSWPRPGPGGTQKWTVARDDRGDCVFFDREAGGLCIIHRDVGPEALPSACRHFPRKILVDHARDADFTLAFLPDCGSLAVDERGTVNSGSASAATNSCACRRSRCLRRVAAAVAAGCPLRHRGVRHMGARGAGCLRAPGSHLQRRASRSSLPRPSPFAAGILETNRSAAASSRLLSRRRSAGTWRWSPARAVERVRALTMGHVGDDLAPIDAFDDRWNECAASCAAWFDSGMKNYLAARLVCQLDRVSGPRAPYDRRVAANVCRGCGTPVAAAGA